MRLLAAQTAIVDADPEDLAKVVTHACRHCHGLDYAFQWRTDREFLNALAAWGRMSERRRSFTPEPTDEGGYGWSVKLPPHSDCPECDGFGIQRVVVRTLSNHPLLAAVEQNEKGAIKIRFHDKQTALSEIARMVGAYTADEATA